MKAFPEIKYVAPQGMGSHVMAIEGGMDLRDYFAAKAMQAYLNKTITAYEHNGCVITRRPNANEISDSAYEVADAMMEARK